MKRFLALFAVLAATMLVPAAPAQADVTICEKWGSTPIQGGRYIVQNNVWGDDTLQCLNVTDTGFTITTASHNKPTNGAPGAYPSVYFGCHYANCSTGSGLPLQASSPSFGSYRTSVNMTFSSSGVYNASYDVWFDPTPRTDGQNTGAEIMIWLRRQGSIQPIGSPVGTVNLNGAIWDVWFGNIGWNVVSYVRTTSSTTADFTIESFYGDAVSRGYAQRSWYMTSIQAGFEPWVGQTGLAVNTFSVTTDGGGGGDTQPPTAPANLSASGVTSSSANLSWSASSDNVGVTGYDIYRDGTLAATVSGTSTTVSGLSAATSYQFHVRARDAAGNVSANSSTVNVTTSPGGGGGDCTAAMSPQSQWNGGYVADVRVSGNAGSGWTVMFTLPSEHAITNSWNAAVSVSGQTVTARNLSYNAGLPASFGFQASRPGSSGLPSGFTCDTN